MNIPSKKMCVNLMVWSKWRHLGPGAKSHDEDVADGETLRRVLEIWKASTSLRGMQQALVEAFGERFRAAVNDKRAFNRARLALACADTLLDSCGVETINERGVTIIYANMGDTYDTTLLYSIRAGAGTWSVGSWGDRVEALNRRGRDQEEVSP